MSALGPLVVGLVLGGALGAWAVSRRPAARREGPVDRIRRGGGL